MRKWTQFEKQDLEILLRVLQDRLKKMNEVNDVLRMHFAHEKWFQKYFEEDEEVVRSFIVEIAEELIRRQDKKVYI